MKSTRSTLPHGTTDSRSSIRRRRRALWRLAALAFVAAAAVLAPASAQATTAIAYPSTNTVVTSPGWVSATNAYADDTAFASATTPGTRNSTVNSDFGGFHFDTSVPSGATINSVTVAVNWYVSTTASTATLGFQPYVSGVAQGTEFTNAAEPLTETIESSVYTGLTRAQLLDGTFAVRVRATEGAVTTPFTAYLDYVKVTVDYTASSGTITLADGTNPGTVSITAGQVGALDGFSLQTDTGTATISSVTVNVGSGSAALSGLSIYSASSCTGGTSYGSIASVAAGANLITTTGLSATTAATTFYVCATGATVASSTTVTGTVSTFATSTGGYSVAGTDPGGATSFTVTPPASNTITLGDGTNPGTVSVGAGQTGALDGFSLVASTGTPTISSVTVNVGSGNAALSGLSIYSASSCTGGTSYGSIASVVAGANLITTTGLTATTTATTRYVCATGGTVQLSTTATGTVSAVATSTSGYTVSGADGAGAASFTVQATADTTTVGDAANPPDVLVLAPGGVAKAVDAFTLKTGTFNDAIQSLTVTLPANVWQGIEAVSIQDVVGCTQSTPFGSATPTGTTVGIPISGLVASTTLKNLWVCVKPKAHVAMPLPPGGTYAVTAKVTGLTSGNTAVYGDTSASATVTIDNASPANVAWGAVTTAATSVTLNWTNPVSDFSSVVILRRQGGPVADAPAEGSAPAVNDPLPNGSVVRYILSASSFTDSSLTGGQPYYYAIFAKDASGNYATGTSLGPVYPGTNALPAGDASTGSTKPVVGIVNPGSGSVAAAGQSFRVQARVFSPGGAAISSVAVTHDGTTWDPLAWVTAYGGSTTSGVWGGTTSIATLGGYTLVVRAINASGTTYSRPVGIAIRSSGGDGSLLVRDNASQLCTDCHAMVPHSSESTGTQYGSWTTTCRDCHTPHGTTNIFLVANSITPPAVGGTSPTPKNVYFTNTSGYASTGGAATRTGSYANGDATGVCQACHTRTQDPVNQSARYRNGGGGTSHDANVPCKNCHAHSTGFAPTNKGCWNCHLGASDVDVWTWGNWTGPTPIIATAEWTTYGHGAVTSTGTLGSGYYPSGNPTAKFDTMGSAVGDHGCFYCHSSSTSHNDPNNYFRLNPANFDATFLTSAGGDGWNSVCLICHGKTATWTAPGFDPDGAGTAYALVTATTKLANDHYQHTSTNPNGGFFCWDCHDPHGDKSGSSNELWFMIQKYPVIGTTGTTTDHFDSGVPDPAKLALAVEFRGNLGGNAAIDFPDYVYPPPPGTPVSGICRVCHTTKSGNLGTNHYNQSTTTDSHPETILQTNVLPRVGAGLSPRDRCTDCHVHAKLCNECHDAPQTAGRHSQHNQVGARPLAYTETGSEATPTQYGFRCAKCHMGTHPKDTHSGTIGDPYWVDMIFDAAASPSNGGATYTEGTFQTPVQGMPNSAYANSYWRWSDGTCASVYCHSNGAPLGAGQTYVSGLKWVSSAATTCTSCHGAKDATTTPPMSAAHAKHINSSPAYAFGCERCHATVVTNNSTFATAAGGGKVLHVNGTKDVAFDASGPDNSLGTYSKAATTCSNTYCHSNGTVRPPAGPPYASGASIAWSTTSNCGSCHSAGTAMATGKHTQHVNNNAVIGTSFACANCHSTVVSGSSTLVSPPSLHVNGSVNVAFAAIGTFSGGTYASPTCNSVYCHSSGQASPTYVPVNWTDSFANVCKGCHGTSRTYGDPD